MENRASGPALGDIAALPEAGLNSLTANEGNPTDPIASTISNLLPYFLEYCRLQWHLREETAEHYSRALRPFVTLFGDLEPDQISSFHVSTLMQELWKRDLGTSRKNVSIAALRSFLRFCREALNIETLDLRQIPFLHVPKREVTYLSPDEIAQFLAAIPKYQRERPSSLAWLRFRALVEVFLGTGLRIAECLSLTRSEINFKTGEAEVIGKGGKKRTIFFTARCLAWVERYLAVRPDRSAPLFSYGAGGSELSAETVQKQFRTVCERSSLAIKVTPHVLRHTVATTLLFNGCPVGFIKEILGHSDLRTTCKYYLGVDNRIAKEAHRSRLEYSPRRLRALRDSGSLDLKTRDGRGL